MNKKFVEERKLWMSNPLTIRKSTPFWLHATSLIFQPCFFIYFHLINIPHNRKKRIEVLLSVKSDIYSLYCLVYVKHYWWAFSRGKNSSSEFSISIFYSVLFIIHFFHFFWIIFEQCVSGKIFSFFSCQVYIFFWWMKRRWGEERENKMEK